MRQPAAGLPYLCPTPGLKAGAYPPEIEGAGISDHEAGREVSCPEATATLTVENEVAVGAD